LSDYEQVVRRHLPRAGKLTLVDTGWDSLVVDVDGDWIFRFARRPEVVKWLRREADLLPRLARALPVPVPHFEFVGDGYVAYRKLHGKPLTRNATADVGTELGRFLRALHALPTKGLDAPDWVAHRRQFVAKCELRVLPLLAEEERAAARAMFADFFAWPDNVVTALVHADLGPEHILVSGGSVAGVIDWSDAGTGDPALDLSWLVNGTNDSFAQAVLDAYGAADDDLLRRALFYHRLGPWHEVLYGQETGRRDLVESGLAGVRARLP
jgi:aminoglycoside phosphotransferase (APT) family kinase protein